MRSQGFLLQPTTRIQRGRAVVQLFGRLSDGRGFLIEDDRSEPYFFVPADQIGLVRGAGVVRVDATELRELGGRAVARVVVTRPGEVPAIRSRIQARGGTPLEADVRFAYRFLIDRGLGAAIVIEGTPVEESDRFVRFHNPELEPGSDRPELQILSLDIETTPDASQVIAIAFAGCGVEEVLLLTDREVDGATRYSDEGMLLQHAMARIRELDPDVLTGWNVVDFDLRVIQRRAEALRVPDEIGRIKGPMSLIQDRSFTRQPRAFVPGRQVLDGIALVRDAFIQLDDYRLETAAQALLGRGKRITQGVADPAAEILRLYREDLPALVAYNLEDARLVLELLERYELVQLAVERSLLSGMQLDRVGASIASFDLLYLPELRRRGFVAPSVDRERKRERIRGGAVLDSSPGLYSNVAVFDFKSLYPTLMRTFNLDPLAHARAGADPIRAPNGAAFDRGDAVLPEVIDRFMQRRAAAKQRSDQQSDLALKIMMNAFSGVLGSASCRFFDPAVANAVTSFGQQTLGWAREGFERAGFRVLYGDTDSVFVELDPDASPRAARELAESLLSRVQSEITRRIQREYRVESALELELERIYTRFFQPTVRGGSGGSKKRYAGLVRDPEAPVEAEGELVIVGLEAVRRDWPAVARQLQRGMLRRLFSDQPVEPFVRQVVDAMRNGELDSELVFRKGLRKGQLERYTATTPPHVRAARKAGAAVDRVVRYVMTRSGPEPVLAGHPLPGGLDLEYYKNKVLRPVADQILQHLGSSFDEALGEARQLRLL